MSLMQYIERTSLPGGVGRVADGEHGCKLLDEGVALQLALVVFQALENDTMVSGVERRLRLEPKKTCHFKISTCT